MTADLIVNGRYLLRPPTGVDVVAHEVVRRISGPESRARIELVAPRGPLYDPTPPLPIVQRGMMKGHFWEQGELPMLARGRPLLSLCNVGPVLSRNQIVVMHDAQFRTEAESYSWAFRNIYRVLLPAVARTSRQVVTVSKFSLTQLHDLDIVPQKKGVVIANGSDRLKDIEPDESILTRSNLTPQGYFLAIGSTAAHKNINMLTRLFAAFPTTCPPLAIAGSVSKSVFRQQTAHSEQNIVTLGRVSDSELKALYSGAIAFLFPSRTEGFGLPPLEAMQAGTLAIVSDAGGIPEACGNAALYAPPDSPEIWRSLIERTLDSSALREDHQEAGRIRSATMTWDRAAADYKELLSDEFQGWDLHL
jgi:glycosyltransferase involved in cell wall biosynthesis